MNDAPPPVPPPAAAPGSATWLARLVPDAWQDHAQWPRLERWGVKLTEFFLAQGLLQLLTALSGFFLLRWMPVNDYALMTLAFAVLGLMSAVTDIGITGSVVPLIGSRTADRDVIATYVAAARRLRTRLLPVAMVGGVTAFVLLGWRQGFGWRALAPVAVAMAATVALTMAADLRGTVLTVQQRLRVPQVTLNAIAVVRFGAYAAGHAGTWLSAIFAVALNALLAGGQAWVYRRRTNSDLQAGRVEPAALQRGVGEIMALVKPQLPLAVFTALQGQLMVLVIGWAGSGNALADVGAVGRLAQLYAFVPPLLIWIVQPYFARIDATLVVRRFWQVGGVVVAGLAVVVAAGMLFPAPFLWLLGAKYGHLRAEVGLVLTANALSVAQAYVVMVSLGRRWVFADAILWVAPAALGVQAIAAAQLDLGRPAAVILLMVLGNAGGLAAYLALARRGWKRDGAARATA